MSDHLVITAIAGCALLPLPGVDAPAAQLTESVRAQLAARYPFHSAIGDALGQVRGAPTIKRLLWQTSDIARD